MISRKFMQWWKTYFAAERESFGISGEKAKLEFIPETEVKPDMLGGIYLRVGDYMWDSSINDI